MKIPIDLTKKISAHVQDLLCQYDVIEVAYALVEEGTGLIQSRAEILKEKSEAVEPTTEKDDEVQR